MKKRLQKLIASFTLFSFSFTNAFLPFSFSFPSLSRWGIPNGFQRNDKVEVSVMINGGSLYISKRDTELSLFYPLDFKQMRLSNSVFDEKSFFPLWQDSKQAVSWRLNTEGPAKVYTQFLDREHKQYTKVVSGKIIVDTVSPNVSFKINNSSFSTRDTVVHLFLNANDTGSGVDAMRITNSRDQLNKTPWEAYRKETDWILGDPTTLKRGERKTVYVQVADRAGVSSRIVSGDIRLLPPLPSPIPTITPTPLPPTITPTPSITPTSTLIPRPTPFPTVTVTPAITVTPTATITVTPTIPAFSPTPTVTVSPTVTPTVQADITGTLTPAVSPTATPSATPPDVITITNTPTITPTIPETASPTVTPSVTSSPTLTPTMTPTSSLTPTPSVSQSSSTILHNGSPSSFWSSFVKGVNAVFGNFVYQKADLSLPGKTLSVSFFRTYNSANKDSGVMGVGWRHSFETKLVSTTSETHLLNADGRLDIFLNNSDGSFATPSGTYAKLSKEPDGSYILSQKNGTKQYFLKSGELSKITSPQGNEINLAYETATIGGKLLKTITDTSSREIKYEYDTSGKLTEVTDPLGRLYKYSYDSSGRLSSYKDPLNNITLYQYDNKDRLVKLINPQGNTILENTYDESDRVISQKDVLGSQTGFSFNTTNSSSVVTDPKGRHYNIGYDGSFRVTSVTNPLDNTSLSVFDDRNNRTQVTDPLGRVWKFTYDSSGNMVQVTDPNGKSSAYEYDAKNSLTKAIDILSNQYAFGYDDKQNLTSATDPLDHSSGFSYSSSGLLTQSKDPNQNATQYSYDQYGNISQSTDPKGKITSFTYDEAGRVLSATNAKGSKSTFQYDANDNLTKTTDPLGNTVTSIFDELNNLTSATNTLGQTVTYSYDSRSLLTSRIDQLGNTVNFEYGELGNRTGSIDPNGKKTSYSYDELNRLVQIADPSGNITKYEYDAVGNRTGVVDPMGNKTAYIYDSLNRLVKIVDPLNNNTTFEYDDLGNKTKMTDSKGQETKYEYDKANRLTKTTYPDGTISYSYDAAGNRTSMEDTTGTTNYTYDELNRLKTVATPDGKTVGYDYDELGQKIKTIYPDNKKVSFEYDKLGRLTKVSDWNNASTQYSYNALGSLLKMTYPNGTVTDYNYDGGNRLTGIVSQSPTAGIINHIEYVLDKTGNRLQMVDNSGLTNYEYDSLYQLTKVTYPDKTWTGYSYDSLGNRLAKNENGNITNYTYDPTGTLLESAGSITFDWDANGNMTRKGNAQYSFDSANRLTKVIKDNGDLIEFAYDGDGKRASKSVNKGKTSYDYDTISALPNVISQHSENSSQQYVYGNSIISTLTDKDPSQKYFHPDGLGSTRELTDSTSKLASSYQYDAFGAIRKQTGSAKNNFLFTGQQYDPETGFYYLRARYYDPEVGRFISRDPVFNINLYKYANNNPVSYIDPMGYFSVFGVDLTLKDVATVAGYTAIGATAIGLAVLAAPLVIPGVTVYAAAGGAVLAFSAAKTLGEISYLATAGDYINTANGYLQGNVTEKEYTESRNGALITTASATFGLTKTSLSLNKPLYGAARASHMYSNSYIADKVGGLAIDVMNEIYKSGQYNYNSSGYPDSGSSDWVIDIPQVPPTGQNISSGKRSNNQNQNNNVLFNTNNTNPAGPASGPVQIVGTRPNRPTQDEPSDYDAKPVGMEPELKYHHNGSPDNAAIVGYWVEVRGKTHWDSNWTSSTTVKPSGLQPDLYSWRVKVIDNRGLESEWSDTRHFTIQSTEATMDDLEFVPQSPSSSERIGIYSCVHTGAIGTGTSLEFWANTATDGSDTGEWKYISAMGYICYNHSDSGTWAQWENLDQPDGLHLVRAIGRHTDVGFSQTMVKEAKYTLNHRRPDYPRIQTPERKSWFNQKEITFTWKPAVNAQTYRLYVGENPVPKNSPIIDTVVPGSQLQKTVNFSSDYNRLYWTVVAQNDIGSNDSDIWYFGIDTKAPVVNINPLPADSRLNFINIGLSGSDELSGIDSYDVQYQEVGEDIWKFLQVGIKGNSLIFEGKNGKTYRIRARGKDIAGNTGQFELSSAVQTSIPPNNQILPWWNENYQYRKNIPLLSFIDSDQKYSVPIKINTQQLTNDGKVRSDLKDLRVVYWNGQTWKELDYDVVKPDEIWIGSQAFMLANQYDPNYYLYYGYGNESTDPPHNKDLIYRYGVKGDYYTFKEGNYPYYEEYKGTYTDPFPKFDDEKFTERTGTYNNIVVKWQGKMYVGSEGTYNMSITQDEGSRWHIDGNLVHNQWNPRRGKYDLDPVTLSRGWHYFEYSYYNDGGGGQIIMDTHIPQSFLIDNYLTYEPAFKISDEETKIDSRLPMVITHPFTIPSPIPLPVMEVQDNLAVLGDFWDERLHEISGWGDPDTAVSRRPQTRRSANILYLTVPEANKQYTFETKTEDGNCDDSFKIFINDQGPVYSYKGGNRKGNVIHSFTVGKEMINTVKVKVTFQNITSDNCGNAATYYAKLY